MNHGYFAIIMFIIWIPYLVDKIFKTNWLTVAILLVFTLISLLANIAQVDNQKRKT